MDPLAFVLGTVIGIPIAVIMPMTAVPQRTAFSHACGALASALIGTAEYYKATQPGPGAHLRRDDRPDHRNPARIPHLHRQSRWRSENCRKCCRTRPMTYKGQNFVNLGIFAAAAVIGIALIVSPDANCSVPVFVVLSLLFGVLLIIPIGGADMPTVIALLNSYAGLSASAMGFVLDNSLLIVAGALDGSSGFILSIIMCRAMNRSFTNVLFGAFGQLQVSAAGGQRGQAVPLRHPRGSRCKSWMPPVRS